MLELRSCKKKIVFTIQNIKFLQISNTLVLCSIFLINSKKAIWCFFKYKLPDLFERIAAQLLEQNILS